MKKYKWALISLGVLVILSPLGLLAKGTAWGEWGGGDLKVLLGYIPQGVSKLSGINHMAFLPDYSLPVLGDSFAGRTMGYYISAVAGAGIIILIVFLIGRIIVRKK